MLLTGTDESAASSGRCVQSGRRVTYTSQHVETGVIGRSIKLLLLSSVSEPMNSPLTTALIFVVAIPTRRGNIINALLEVSKIVVESFEVERATGIGAADSGASSGVVMNGGVLLVVMQSRVRCMDCRTCSVREQSSEVQASRFCWIRFTILTT